MKKINLIAAFVILFVIAGICSGASLGKDDKGAQKEFQKLFAGANNNDTSAMSKLGDCYFFCQGTEGDLKEAFKWYLLAAKAGDVHANYMLGYCYLNGYGVDSDYSKACQYYETAARSGSLDAMNELPSIQSFTRFNMVKNNIKLFQTASANSEKPSVEQNYFMGVCYFYGKGVKQDVQKGLGLLEKASGKGSWKASKELADIYYEGREVDRDEKKARKYMESAANQIGAFGRYQLAFFEFVPIIVESRLDTPGERLERVIDEINGVSKSSKKTKEEIKHEEFNAKMDKIIDRLGSQAEISFLEGIKKEENKKFAETAKKAKKKGKEPFVVNFELAANDGFAPAQYQMGEIEEALGNSNASYAWFEKAAQRGFNKANGRLHGEGYKDYLTAIANYDSEAQYKLGKILLDESSLASQKDGFEFINLSMDNGYDKARFEVAQCYFYGKGTDEDKQKAYYLYQVESEKGNRDAQYMRGEYFWNGYVDIRKELSTAFSWYLKAAEQKQPLALVKVGICYLYGYGTGRDPDKAFSYLKSADSYGEDSGYYDLGLCYEVGLGTEPSGKKAFEYYSLSENNDIRSKLKLANCYRKAIGTSKDVKRAVDYLIPMAREKYVPALIELGDVYSEEGSYRSALDCYSLACKTSSYANYRIGECYLLGRSVEKSSRQAVTYFKQAVELAEKNIKEMKDDASDHYCLALCYETGRGKEKNMDSALEHYKKAANFNFGDSAEKVKSLQARGN